MIGLVCIASAALAATPRGPEHASWLGTRFGRDALLVTPAPFPPESADDASRPERSRVWIERVPVGSRTPISEQTLGAPGPASYGAAPNAGEPVLVRIGHTPIAIDPFTRIDGGGSLARLERARNIWLAEQGYVLHVRTHVNAAARPEAKQSKAGERETDGAELPKPRATIRLESDEPHTRPARLRVEVCPRVVEPSVVIAREE